MYPVAKVDCMYLVDKTASWVLFELDGGIDGRGTAICACVRLGLAFTEAEHWWTSTIFGDRMLQLLPG